ncbi:hypothetical protein RQP46_006201 [Phenoliferia psychrophenolica]
MVARNVAPNGGKRAANLRLVSRRLDAAVAPVVWSSIVFSSNQTILDEICGYLIGENDDANRRALVTSVRYDLPPIQLSTPLAVLKRLPNLNRLHLLGATTLSTLRPGTIDTLPITSTLRLENVDLQDQWASAAAGLEVIRCSRAGSLFLDRKDAHGYYHPWPPSLRTLRYEAAPTETAVDVQYTLLATTSITGPLSLTVTGMKDLFGSATPTATRALTTATFVRVWNHFATGTQLDSLNLETNGAIVVNDGLFELDLPHLTTLKFTNLEPVPEGGFAWPTNLLEPAKFSNFLYLAKLLKEAKLPVLRTLELRGWVDAVGAATLASMTMGDVAGEHPLVHSLLGVLKGIGATELRLVNSSVRIDADVHGVFSLVDGEWVSRVARFW